MNQPTHTHAKTCKPPEPPIPPPPIEPPPTLTQMALSPSPGGNAPRPPINTITMLPQHIKITQCKNKAWTPRVPQLTPLNTQPVQPCFTEQEPDVIKHIVGDKSQEAQLR